MKFISGFLICILTNLFASAQDTISKFEKRVIEMMNADFERKIGELLKHADNDFEDIKGEEIEIDGIPFNDHKSKLELEGAKENKITRSVWTRFVALFPGQKDSAAAFYMFNKRAELIKKVMGNKSTMKTSPLKEEVSGFTIFKTQMTEFRKTENEFDAYYVELKIYRPVVKTRLLSTSYDEGWQMELTVHKE